MLIHCRVGCFLIAMLWLAGCESRGLTLNVSNDSAGAIRTIEIDYPGGSYGIASLRPGERRTRWVRLIGSAAIKIDFLDEHSQRHASTGITLRAGETGAVNIHVLDGGRVSIEDRRVK